MVNRLTIEKVAKTVSAVSCDAVFIRNMWRYALEHADLPDAAVPCSEHCDAIPYLPVQPELLGLALNVSSVVLDVGCLGGYGLYDLMMRRQKAGLPLPNAVGIDVDPVSIKVSRLLARQWAASERIRFELAGCEKIPLEDASVDLIIARLVLPYLPLQASVAEMSRVLKPGGAILIQTHAPRYYFRSLWMAFPRLRQVVYYAKPLVGGLVFALTGWQFGMETALGRRAVRKLLHAYGLVSRWQGGFESKPLMWFERRRMDPCSAQTAD